jgi:hypothetical protein
MAEPRIINLDKVQLGLEKLATEPDLLKGVNTEFDKLFAVLAIELNWQEKSYLLAQLTLIGAEGARGSKDGPPYYAIPAS